MVYFTAPLALSHLGKFTLNCCVKFPQHMPGYAKELVLKTKDGQIIRVFAQRDL